MHASPSRLMANWTLSMSTSPRLWVPSLWEWLGCVTAAWRHVMHTALCPLTWLDFWWVSWCLWLDHYMCGRVAGSWELPAELVCDLQSLDVLQGSGLVLMTMLNSQYGLTGPKKMSPQVSVIWVVTGLSSKSPALFVVAFESSAAFSLPSFQHFSYAIFGTCIWHFSHAIQLYYYRGEGKRAFGSLGGNRRDIHLLISGLLITMASMFHWGFPQTSLKMIVSLNVLNVQKETGILAVECA